MGGLAVSSLLAEHAPKASITIVEQKKIFEFPPSFPLLAMGRREPGKVRRALSIPRKRKVRLVNDRINSIETSSRRSRRNQKSCTMITWSFRWGLITRLATSQV